MAPDRKKMETIPPHIDAFANCPVCEDRIQLTHSEGEHFDLRPVELHIVQAHPEMKGSPHVPNVRVQWGHRATTPE